VATISGTRAERRGGTGLGTTLIVLGALALVHQFGGFGLGPQLGALALIAAGVAFFVGMFAGNIGALAIPGSVLTTIGLILGYQNFTGYYASWTYAWALIVVAVGLGIFIRGFWDTEPKAVTVGKRLVVIGLAMFSVFGLFFETGLHISGFGAIGGWLWPVILVGLGLALTRNGRK
jgi:hypothetical protein